MSKAQIQPSSFKFLNTLKKNNDRDWFQANKESYLKELAVIENFADRLLAELNTHDLIETVSGKKSLYRIYRDTRFSTDKTPYKTHWSGSFKRATKYRRGGYYFHIEPGNSLIAGGFWGPATDDLKRIREDIAFDDAPLRKILSDPTFVQTFGELRGEQLKTAPKGYDAENSAIDLLRYKQFLLVRKFTDQEVLDDSFLQQASLTFSNMRPFFNYMSEVLTSDSDGLSL
ncbi:DUF2461 domain-containing protein [Pedobacter sp. KR3-3]|uniref:DUF2461 domain-containing protein n=1 Tax=Pedobacter albus TaxID=3113905 RepID=A0ABU7I5Y8_9SPHI|nr:DUF2461 domain-containing protein [Pedobacter sp. KR3-3]MEE1944894.1 DUF2461 domain-containing protein [Pedobacter sp. KR3-3]